jgi:hypothetical protein
MGKAHAAFWIDDEDRGHASEFEQVDLLVIGISDARANVRAAGEGHVIFFPIAAESIRAIGTQRDDLRAAGSKFGIVLTQLRQMLAAVGSDKSARENQNNGLFALVIGQADGIPVGIEQIEGGSGGKDGEFCGHDGSFYCKAERNWIQALTSRAC